MYESIREQLTEIMAHHNDLVLDAYKATDEDSFFTWFYCRVDYTDSRWLSCFVEIPSNETKSGAPAILEVFLSEAETERVREDAQRIRSTMDSIDYATHNFN